MPNLVCITQWLLYFPAQPHCGPTALQTVNKQKAARYQEHPLLHTAQGKAEVGEAWVIITTSSRIEQVKNHTLTVPGSRETLRIPPQPPQAPGSSLGLGLTILPFSFFKNHCLTSQDSTGSLGLARKENA